MLKQVIKQNVACVEKMPFVDKLRREFSFFRGNYLTLVISWILIDFAGELPGTYYSQYVLELGGSEFIVGVIAFLSLLALALVQFPGGYLADKHGRRWLVSTMTFGVAFSYLFYALAPSWHAILIGAVVSNLCLIYQPAIMAMIADSLSSERRGMGYSIIMLISSVSTTPAPIFAGLLILRYDFVTAMRIGYTIVTILFLIAAALRIKLRETLKDPKEMSFRDFFHSYPVALKESARVWGTVPSSMLYLFIAMVMGTFSIAMIQPYFVVYALNVLQIEKFDWSLILTSLFIAMIILSLPAGKLIDKVGRKIPLLVSYMFMVPATLLFVYGDLFKLYVALPMIGLSMVLLMSSFSSLQDDLIPRGQRGKVTGFTNFFNNIFMALGSLIGGALYYFVWPQLPFLLVLPFVAFEFLLTLFLVREPKKREE